MAVERNRATVRQRMLSTVACGVFFACGANAWAQTDDAPESTGQSATTGGSFDRIVVTARKRQEETLQDVPIAITAIVEQELARRGSEDFLDYVRLVPSLNFEYFGPAGARGDLPLTFRGIPSVGYYIDETNLNSAADPQLFDVARVEALRGPQGTLYGAGSMGGTVRIITNQPNLEEFEGKVEATLSNSHEGGVNYRTAAMINIPISEDRVALRGVGIWL